MTDIGRTNPVVPGPIGHGVSTATLRTPSWGQKFDAFFIASFNTLTGWLCRASRGYLCPPDMHQIMFPDEPHLFNLSNPPTKECCDEKLRRK